MKKLKYSNKHELWEPQKDDIAFYPDNFQIWYRDNVTTLYVGLARGGGEYYEVNGDFRRQCYKILAKYKSRSAKRLIEAFEKRTNKDM